MNLTTYLNLGPMDWSYIEINNRYTFVDRQYLQYFLLVFALSGIIRGTI